MLNKNIRALEQEYDCIIPDKRVRVWEVQMRLWELFDDICKRHNLRYYFCWGSLLGAVRHQGFIPWDDDIDVTMPRKDYDRFAEVAVLEIKPPYHLLTDSTVGNAPYWNLQLVDESTTCITERKLNSTEAHQGICLDIVPLDGYSNNKLIRFKMLLAEKGYRVLVNRIVFGANIPEPSITRRVGAWLSRGYCRVAGRKHGIEQLEKARAVCAWDESDIIIDSVHRHPFSRADFEGVLFLDFEGKKAPVPVGYENILKELYGDYMKLPEPKFRMVCDHIAAGDIVDPDIPYAEYFELIQRQKRASRKEKSAFFKRFLQ